MGAHVRHAATLVKTNKNIDPGDVLALLREVYAEGIVTREEAEELLAFDRSLAQPSAAWTDFIAATIADHVLLRTAPIGLIDEGKVKWLVAALAGESGRASAGGLAAVLRMVESAGEAPTELLAFAIAQLRSAVVSGKRRPSSIPIPRPHSADGAVAATLRCILFAGSGAVSRAEAEALFDLHDAVAGGTNHAEFERLFINAIVHHLLARGSHAVPERRGCLAAAAPWANMQGKVLGGDDQAWLASRIMRDGKPTVAERALLQFFAGGAGECAA
jgi:hypothetical protein